MVTIEEAENKAVEFVKKKKNDQEITVSEIVVADDSRPDNWRVKGTTKSEKFEIEVDEEGAIVGYKFSSKPKFSTM